MLFPCIGNHVTLSLTFKSILQKNVDFQETISVYDALGELPLSSLSYANVLKPLIDLDFFSQTKNSWMDVSQKPKEYRDNSDLSFLSIYPMLPWMPA